MQAQGTATLRAAGYCRVSSTGQAERGLSLGVQQEKVRARAVAEGWAWTDTYVDAGLSGRHDDRPELMRLLADAEAGRFERLIIPALDRLARNAAHTLRTFERLERAGVAVVCLHEGFDTSTSAGRMVRTILAGVAEMESDAIGERTSAVSQARAREGRPHGGERPLGLRYEGGRLVPVPGEAEAVLRFFREWADEGLPQLEIARRARRDGLRAARGGELSQKVLSRMLRNVLYAGKVRSGGKVYEGQHEAIVPPDLWDRAQARFADPRERRTGRPPKGGHLLAGGVACCECGATLVVRGEGYQCGRRHEDGVRACPLPKLPRALVDDAVTGYFARTALDVEATRTALAEQSAHRLAQARASRELAERDALGVAGKLQRAEADYLAGELPARLYAPLEARLSAERDAAEAQVGRLRQRELEVRQASVEGVASRTEVRAAIVRLLRDAETLDARRAALSRIFETFVIRLVTPELLAAWEVADAHELRAWTKLAVGHVLIEPKVRPEAVVQLSPDRRIVLKTPLVAGEKGGGPALAGADLFAPILVAC